MQVIKSMVVAALVSIPFGGFAGDAVTNVTWKSSISLGATMKSGNTDKALYTMNLKGDRYAAKSDWINSLYAEYGQTEVDVVTDSTTTPVTTTKEDEQTEGQLRGQSEYRYKFGGKNLYGGVFSEAYHDALKKIRYRIKIGPNIGYYFINEETMKFDASIGANYVQEKTSAGTDDFAEYRAAANYLWDISENASYYLNVEYTANAEDVDDGSGLLVTGIKSKVSNQLSVFVELRDEYDNKTPEGSDVVHNDTTLLAGLTYDF
jgi:hypothetical protein